MIFRPWETELEIFWNFEYYKEFGKKIMSIRDDGPPGESGWSRGLERGHEQITERIDNYCDSRIYFIDTKINDPIVNLGLPSRYQNKSPEFWEGYIKALKDIKEEF